MNDVDYPQRYGAALMNTFGAPKLVLSHGHGAVVVDEHGKEYVDLLAGIAVNALGHGHPALVAAVTEQMTTLGHISNFFASKPQIELAEKLLELVSGSLADPVESGRVFFTNSGTEANEAGFKLTRRTGRTHLVAAKGSFHGRTMGALALTSKEAYRAPFEPLPGEVTFVDYGDVDALRAAVTEQTAAIVLEPIQGEAGVIVPPADYLAAARGIADAHGALLWFDEVQTGVGRTGHWFAHAATPETAVVPDIITLAKGLGGGFPIGACIGLGRSATLFEPGNHGTTFGGNPPACAAALAVITVIEREGLLDNARKRGAQFKDGLADQQGVVAVHGEGLLLGVELDAAIAPAVAAAAQEAGFIVNAPTPDRIRLAPPLNLTETQVEAFTAAWDAIVTTAHQTLNGGATP